MLPVFIYVKISCCNMVRAFIKQKLRTRRNGNLTGLAGNVNSTFWKPDFPHKWLISAIFRHFCV